MNRRRKFGVGIGVSVLIVLILLFAALLIAPKVVDSEAVKARVRSEIKETADIDIDFEHLVLDFFSHPHIIIDRVVLSMPPNLKGKAVSVSVYPKILPLFLGKMQITDLRLESAELDYTLPKKATEGKAMPQPITYYNLAKKIQSVAATLPEFKIPDLVLGPDKLNVKKLFIQDKATRATIRIFRHNEILTFSFRTYDLKGRFRGRGKAEDMLKTATGQAVFTAKDGRIYHDVILIEVLKFLNPLEVFEGRVNAEDMNQKGFGYHSFGVKAKLQDGKLRYDEAVLHGQPMTVTAAGEHDLQNGRFDLTLMVAPLLTLDRIFEHIPLIGGILEALDTIPLSANGTLDNIQIYPLAPLAIGYELAEMLKKTVERPINLIHGGKSSED